tara:strand:+ start:6561 stop:7982 length:1422 start_codon:yes stop_codon:yes gene_type:complete
MPSNNNNTNWKKKSGSDTIYETDLPFNKYDDPNNPIDKKKGIVISRFNVVDGEIQLFEKKGSTETLMSTIKADGSQRFDSGDLYTTYFDADPSNDRGKQLNQVLELTKNQAVIKAKEELSPQDFSDVYENSETYKSVSNDSQTDPDTPDVSPPPDNYRDPAQTGKAIPEGKSVLRYPVSVPELGYDFIRITAYEYTAGGRQALTLKNKLSAKKRIVRDATKKETVILPMQPNFSESNAVSWGGDNLNPLQAVLGRAAMGGIEGIGNIANPSVALEKMGDALKDVGTDLQAMFNDPMAEAGLIAYFAGQAVGANILGRTAGVTLNPNLELLFKGPNLRTFNFNFRFTPRSPKEAKEVKEIIRVFKKNMAVQRSTSNLFLLTPRVFTLEYVYNAEGNDGGKIHPYLNIFKPMAMTNLNVNYTPDGTYMTYNDGGSLTAYDLQMSFGELEPIYADEFDDPDDAAVGPYVDHRNMGY